MIIKQKLSTNNRSRGKNTCEYIVLHHTATKEGSIKGVINQLTVWPVSCHFIVDTNGDIYQIGILTDILWHAGVSQWDGKSNMNNYSVGIEIIWPLPWFTDAQRKSVRELVNYLLDTLKLLPSRIIRHKDIAPGRKTDVDDSFWNNEYKTFTDYQHSYMETTTQETVSEFKQVYIQERKNWYKPSFTDYSGSKPATISDIKYLIEINNIRRWI